MQRTSTVVSNRDGAGGELDFRGFGAVLKRRRRAILIPTCLAFLIVGAVVNVITPRYTAESQVLLENQETFFTRPDRTTSPGEQASLVDPEAVGSQIQLMTSRDLARRAIKDLGLQGDPEFDPAARGMGPLSRILVLLGIARDPTQEAAETRILQAFQDKLTVFSPPKTRVITIQFQSNNPLLAARAANKIAELYLSEQSAAKRVGAKDAADALSGQIADLRIKLAKADAEREQYRAASGLLAGNNNLTISGQQLADINGDLSKARSAQAEAQAKASMIRELIRSGKTADVADVINNDLVRRVSEQRVTAQSQLALEARTLLPGHPRIKALTAQVAELDTALKAAAKQAASTLENESKISGQRVANLETVLTQQKKVASTANGDEVRLRSLDRVAQSYKDQLESSSAKYQEALARENSTATPADARIIARAVQPQEPTFPKKLPFTLFGTVATFVFAVGIVLAREMLADPQAPGDGDINVVPMTRRSAGSDVERRSSHGPDPDIVSMPASATMARDEAAHDDSDGGPDGVFAPVQVEPVATAAWTPVAMSVPPKAKRGLRLDWRHLVNGLKMFGQSAAASRGIPVDKAATPRPLVTDWDDDSKEEAADADDRMQARAAHPAPSGDAVDIRAPGERIVASHVPGRGLHVVCAGLGSDVGATEVLDLGRFLSDRGRTIIVDLNASPARLAPLAGMAATEEASIDTLAGLSELLSGSASFAEVIHRDQASRLHFIPTGLHEADFRDFDLILDALSETYDFILLLAPDFPRSEIAKVMAPYADYVVLTVGAGLGARTLAALRSELSDAGAREVLVIGNGAEMAASREPNVA